MSKNSSSIEAHNLILAAQGGGITVIPSATPLTRLHYFDGKLLSAESLELEQRYLMSLVALSNQAGGSGVVHGFDVTRGNGDQLVLGAGLAIDPQGRVLLLPVSKTVTIDELIEQGTPFSQFDSARRAAQVQQAQRGINTIKRSSGEFGDCSPARAPDPVPTGPADLFLISIAHAEALCGQEDVLGALCEKACASATARPYTVEGVVVFATPLSLDVSLAPVAGVVLDRQHLRSRVASAYFARETTSIATLISKAGLASATWCLGAQAANGFAVPLAVVDRVGKSTTFVDEWIARRERIETPARRYWAYRMSMRPWDVFLAHVLQFQCQLHDLFQDGDEPEHGDDPCRERRQVIGEAQVALEAVTEHYQKVTAALKKMPNLAANVVSALSLDSYRSSLGMLQALGDKLTAAGKKGGALPGAAGLLVRAGILETPSAGYLPVVPSSTISVNRQVRALLGDGVDLRFCIVRPDYVPHALEEAQHMERISLLEGLSDPKRMPHVDVLIPGGEFLHREVVPVGRGFAGQFTFLETGSVVNILQVQSSPLKGVGRAERLNTGGGAFYFAGVGEAPKGTGIDGIRAIHARVPEAPFADVENFSESDVREVEIPVAVRRVVERVRRTTSARRAARDAREIHEGASEAVSLGGRAAAKAVRARAFWMALSSTRDPFALQYAESTAVSGRVILVEPEAAGSERTLEFGIEGEFRVTEATPLAGGRKQVVGLLKALLALEGAAPGVLRTIRIVFAGDAEAGTLQVSIPLQAAVRGEGTTITFDLDVKWGATPQQVRGRSVFEIRDKAQNSRQIPLHQIVLEQDATVLINGPLHDAALDAIEIIDAVLDEPAFRAAAEGHLFPRPAPQAEALVRATQDWVLFHRRREKDCGERERVIAAPVRHYRLFAAMVDNQEQVELVREALLKNSPVLARFEFVPVTELEFAGGSPQLLTPPDVLAKAWLEHKLGDRLVHAAIGSRTEAEAEGDALAAGRLQSLETALLPVAKPESGIRSDVLADVPEPALDPRATDGIIALVSLKPQEVVLREARLVIYVDRESEQKVRWKQDIQGVPLQDADVVLKFANDVLDPSSPSDRIIAALLSFGMSIDVVELAMRGPADAGAKFRLEQVVKVLSTVSGATFNLIDQGTSTTTVRDLRVLRFIDEPSLLEEEGHTVQELLVVALPFFVGIN